MSTQVRFRRGTTSDHSTFTGAEGEVTIDTDKNIIKVHDGVTIGGNPIGNVVYNESSGANQSVSFALNGIHRANCTGSDPIITFSFVNPDDVVKVDLILDIDEYSPGQLPQILFPPELSWTPPSNFQSGTLTMTIITDDSGQSYEVIYLKEN